MHLYISKMKKQCWKFKDKCNQNYLTAIVGPPNANTKNVVLCCEKGINRLFSLSYTH